MEKDIPFLGYRAVEDVSGRELRVEFSGAALGSADCCGIQRKDPSITVLEAPAQ